MIRLQMDKAALLGMAPHIWGSSGTLALNCQVQPWTVVSHRRDSVELPSQDIESTTVGRKKRDFCLITNATIGAVSAANPLLNNGGTFPKRAIFS